MYVWFRLLVLPLQVAPIYWCYKYRSTNILIFFFIFFWRARVCRPLLCLCRPFMIFEGCPDSNPEYCRSKLAGYRLSHPSLYLATHPST
jgi:hypothetical protein